MKRRRFSEKEASSALRPVGARTPIELFKVAKEISRSGARFELCRLSQCHFESGHFSEKEVNMNSKQACSKSGGLGKPGQSGAREGVAQ
jgi:hypothetical protein